MADRLFEDREKTCCFTGHRNLTDEEKISASRRVTIAVEALVKARVTNFITGGALGFDTVACVTLINLKRQKYPHISIGVAVPCRDQSARWSFRNKTLYNTILQQADKVAVLSESYTPRCMQERNMFMVDNSKFCVAYLKTESGGTYNTVRYAKECGLTVINVTGPAWDIV